MRLTICEEGNDWLPNQLIEPGALKWEEEKNYPIYINNDHLGNVPIGRANDIQRLETGPYSVITAEVHWSEKMLKVSPDGPLTPGLGLTVYAHRVDWGHGDDGRMDGTVKSAKLKGLFVAEVPWGVRDEN